MPLPNSTRARNALCTTSSFRTFPGPSGLSRLPPRRLVPNHAGLRSCRRPRLVTLVDFEKQQGKQELLQEDGNHYDDSLFPPPLELAYRDADYDTDPGIAMTRPRAVGGTADMRRGTGRGGSADGGGGRGLGSPAAQEGAKRGYHHRQSCRSFGLLVHRTAGHYTSQKLARLSRLGCFSHKARHPAIRTRFFSNKHVLHLNKRQANHGSYVARSRYSEKNGE